LKCVKITPKALNGNINIPPSKSICHRAIIAAGLSDGTSCIENVALSKDIIATIDAMKCLGADIKVNSNSLFIKGCSRLNPNPNADSIHCFESGSTLRFIIPIAILTGKKITFTGEGRLNERPLNPYIEIFNDKNIYYSKKDGLPLTVQGRLPSGEYRLKGDVSSQFITGLTFALPLLDGDSSIILTSKLESRGYIDLSLEVLERFNIHILNNGYNEFFIKGNQKYMETDFKVEGDYSQAAFFIAAGILGGDVRCFGLNEYSSQGDKKIIDIVKEMGGDIYFNDGVLSARESITHGAVIDASECPDLVPILAVLASLSNGETKIINAKRLRLKESDRLKAMATELTKLGADIEEMDDGLVINGKSYLNGGCVDSWGDHRIAMALSIASIRCKNPVTINGSDSVEKSYPDFFKDFLRLGGVLDEQCMGE
jgi:3-phosphoshikimate 1-carboxyvinyltransferase